MLEGQVVVAHMATFDIGVLRQSVARYQLSGVDLGATCSWRLSKLVWPELPSFGLGYLASQFSIVFDHHDAGQDAAVCAQVVLRAQGRRDSDSLRSLLEGLGLSVGQLAARSFEGVSAATTQRDVVGDARGDPTHPLYGKCLAFTGDHAQVILPRPAH